MKICVWCNKSTLSINRNIDNSQKITKDIITGALNGSMTIDNRLFTSDGRSSIANDFKNLGSNLHTLYKDITKNNIIVQSVKNAVTNKDKNIVDAVKDYVRDSKQIDQIRDNKEITDNLNGMTNLDAENVRDTMQNVVNIASQDGGFNANVNIYEEYGSGDGYSYSDKNDPNNNTIGVNVRNTDIADSNKIINVLFHETTNQEQHSANERTALNRGNTAEAIWDMKNYANTNTNKMTGSQWLNNNINSPVIKQGNDNYLANAMRYTYDNKDGSKTFNQSNANPYNFKISKDGRVFISTNEGQVVDNDGMHVAYNCQAGMPTIGTGHLITKEEMENRTYENGLTENEKDDLFKKDLGKVENLMNLTATREYKQNEVDAVGDLLFNFGPKLLVNGYNNTEDGSYDIKQIADLIEAGKTSNTLKKINNQNTTAKEIEKQFGKWVNVYNSNTKKMEPNDGLIKRREADSQLYNTGSFKNLIKYDNKGKPIIENSYNKKLQQNKLIYNK